MVRWERWERWEAGEVGKVGKVRGWRGGKVGGFWQDEFKIFGVVPGIERLSLHLLRAFRNIDCALEVWCISKLEAGLRGKY